MSKVCLACVEVVTNNINPNHNGIAIHYGQDWYCGPVVEIAEDVLETTLSHLEAEKKHRAYLEDRAVEQMRALDACPECGQEYSGACGSCAVGHERG